MMKETSEFFAFRQRVGKLNWKVINSVDVDDLVDKVNVNELQTVLDSLTFCQFTDREINNQSSTLVTKVCHLMQYTIEYLLHCQEMQAQKLDNAFDTNEELKMKHLKLKMAHVANKEALKEYKKQLDEFKESARNLGLEGKLFPSASTTNKMRVVMEPKAVSGADAPEGGRKNTATESLERIVESIQQREADSIEQLAAVLRQQRDHFFREVGQRTTGERMSGDDGARSVREEGAAAVRQITELFETYKKQMQGERERQLAASVGVGVSADAMDLQRREAAFEEERRRWEAEARRAEAVLEARAEEAARARLSAQSSQQSPYRTKREKAPSTSAAAVATSTSSLFATGSSEEPAADGPDSPELTIVEVNYHRNALILIKHMLLRYFIQYSAKHSLRNAWARWRTFGAVARCASLATESEQAVQRQAEAAAVRQAELTQQVTIEKQKGVIAAARHNSAVAKLREGYEKQLQTVKLELLRYHQRDEELDRGRAESVLAGEHQAAAVSVVHPLVLEARTEDDLYLKLQGRVLENPVINSDYSRIMSDIAAEMGERLTHYA